MCRDSLQKDRGWGDVFIEGCVCLEMEGGGGSVVLVVVVAVVVVDMYMGWVKKKLWITLPTRLNGVSTQCAETTFKRVRGGVTYLLRGVCVEMGGRGGIW